MGPRPIRGLSLCTGIAGIELGLHLALSDYRTVCAVEWDAYAQSILIARQADGTFEPFPIWDDVATFPSDEWVGKFDLISAGFPCQPWSLAGKRQGTEDDRWLWPAIADIIRVVRPRLVFVENVSGLISGGGMGIVLGELAALGFAAEWGCFRASDVGATHRRERVFILAMDDSRRSEWRENSFAGSSAGKGEDRERKEAGWPTEPSNAMAYAGRWSQHALESFGVGRRCGSSVTGEAGPAVAYADTRRLESIGSSRLFDGERQTFGNHSDGCDRSLFPPGPSDADGWRAVLGRYPDLAPATESALRRVADGLPRRVDQLKALGNAVVPLVAAHAFRTLRNRLERG